MKWSEGDVGFKALLLKGEIIGACGANLKNIVLPRREGGTPRSAQWRHNSLH